ncbi:MAG: PIN domain-containing protein [Candidatus Eremiobacterota bacterium]
MRVLLDSSVWVPALLERHPRHEEALRHVQSGERLHVAGHSLAEVFAVLTSLPARPRISPGVARRLISESVLARSKVVTLEPADYESVLVRMADLGLAGGTVCDALVVQAGPEVRGESAEDLQRSRLPPRLARCRRTPGGAGLMGPGSRGLLHARWTLAAKLTRHRLQGASGGVRSRGRRNSPSSATSLDPRQ